ncbi:DUF2269 domain-containing protein [Reyranella aquatilis]|uniref:DUF2269 domain-containing protein n=1 Tax=Reyranella aquatilis TaxID=2035356 RepID=A0ABS8KSR7_9HYPH|nr:DUF2269 domain-containing protein [Reyranella aquatilis]MCC8429059.1 DUF2269 domain-containing protein [Reyranella aquatilis]
MSAGIDAYLWLKWLHILSSTVLFGTGIGTAFQMWMAHRRGDVAGIAVVSRNVVLADWMFTLPAGVVQPATGLALVLNTGLDPMSSWLVAAYLLYLLAFVCWVPVVLLQIRVRDMAACAVATRTPLPAAYERDMKLWFALGWPAFSALVFVFLLMVAKPDLW